jgi:hypothetical protein
MIELEVVGRIVAGVVVGLAEDLWVPVEAGGGVEDMAAGGDMAIGIRFRR